MLEKMKAFWAVFQAGQAVADKQKWRTHQINANAIAAFLFAIVSLAKACGYDLGIDMQTCADISIGLLALANVGFTVATSKGHGLSSGIVREAEPSVRSDEQAAAEEPTRVQAEGTPDAGRGNVDSSIDDDVRARAIEWARQHSVARCNSATNNLSNDA
jgi:hypothetical protein